MAVSGKRLYESFRSKFGGEPAVSARAPGRVNLIGEHTDYNDGFVMPCAISREVAIAGAPRVDGKIRVHSLNFDETAEAALTDPFNPDKPRWLNYIEGAVRCVGEFVGARIGGFDAVVDGDVPLGSGLSSSAALEVAAGVFTQELFTLDVPPVEMAKLCRRAEHEYIGVKCGIMDQFASRLCAKGAALFLDCRSLEYKHIPFNLEGHTLFILESGVSRGLADSAYNDRRDACARGAALLKKNKPSVTALRDVSIEEFVEFSADWDPTLRAVCEHVVRENDRALRSADLLRAGDAAAFGRLLYESHDSLRDLYRVSCAELDALVDISRETPGSLGARMTGAGFGGCALALVENGAADEYEKRAAAEYKSRAGRELKLHRTTPAAGAGRMKIAP